MAELTPAITKVPRYSGPQAHSHDRIGVPGWDSIYNVLVTFRDLNAQMCGLKQGANEPIKAYYERMADISVKHEQYHGDRFGPGELRNMKKDCFYAGLKEHKKYLVSHMEDWDQYGPAQMLKEIREQEDSRYPANTTPKPHNHDGVNKNPTQKGGGERVPV